MAGLLLLFCTASVSAQNADIQKTITQKDSLFWVAFNACDENGMHEFVADDVEFYHDKGGIQKGWPTFVETTRKNLCGRRAVWKMRREATAGTYRIFPMEDNGQIYGAILYGEHRFFVAENNNPEYWTGIAKFTHLWLLQDGKWKMARILSYDHGPGPSQRKSISLPGKTLKQFQGKYDSKQGVITVAPGKNLLSLALGGKTYEIYPESETLFFLKERDVTFEFVKSGTKVGQLVVRENGNVVETASKK